MVDKLKSLVQMSEFIATNSTQNYENWTHFLKFSGRFYKYTYDEQISIYFQRPEATAVASYEIWNQQMRRYIKRGSVGIAVVDNTGNSPRLRYLFDISDTGTKQNSRSPNIWQMSLEHENVVTQDLEQQYGISSDVGSLESHLEVLAMQKASEYWEAHSDEVSGILDESALEVYDVGALGFTFRKAVSNSTLYQLISRCLGNPDDYFGMEDFSDVFDFNTPQTAAALGTAVNTISSEILRQIELSVRSYNRNHERSHDNEAATDLYPQRGLSHPQPQVGERGAEASEQVRTDASDISEGAPPHPVQHPGNDPEAVPAPLGDSGNSRAQTGADHARASDAEPGPRQGDRSDGVGTAHEQPEGPGGRSDSEGTDLRLTEETPPLVETQFSFFPTEAEQIESIAEAERAEPAPSAFSFTQEEIDHVLRLGGNTDRQREQIVAEFEKQKSTPEIAAVLQRLYHGGNGIGSINVWYDQEGIRLSRGESARYDRSAQVISWSAAAQRIGQLLEAGQFATNIELAEAEGYERSLLAEQLWNLYHDFSEEARVSGYLESLSENPERGFPEQTAWIAEQLKSSEFQTVLAAEFQQLLQDYQQDRHLLRFHYHKLDEILASLQDLELPRRTFSTENMEVPSSSQHITQDEIDAALASGSGVSGGKGRIFAFFQESHTEKEKADFLKHEHGIGGHSHALSGATYSEESHDSKGMRFKKQDCPDVSLSWEKVSRRITDLIRKGRYLTEQEQAEYDKIQEEKALAESAPELETVGRIEYLGTNGEPGEVVAYTDAEQFIQDIREETYYGAPITVVLYRDAHGQTIPQDFLKELDPPPKGFRVENAPVMEQAIHTQEQTQDAQRMAPRYQVIVYHPVENGFDERRDYPTLREAEEAAQKYVDGSMEPDGFAYDGAAVYDLTDKKYLRIYGEYPDETAQAQVNELAQSNDLQVEMEAWKSQQASEKQDVVDALSDEEFARDYLVPGETTFQMNGRTFMVDRVNENSGTVNLQDITFVQAVGFPIFRVEPIAAIRQYLEPQQEIQPAQSNSFIDHYYVVEDLQVRGALQLKQYSTFEEAMAAYRSLPTDQVKALGVQNTRTPLPGSLDLLQCKDGHDTLIRDYERVDGWQNPEILELVGKIDAALRENRVNAAPAENFVITDEHLGEGGPKAKFQANIRAIQLLRELESTGQQATPEQQEVLSRYVGWGGLADAFDPDKESWSKEYAQLKELLTPEEYAAARGSTLNAHYTSPTVIRAIYEAVGRMGFETGNILEPSCGVGNFFGMLPESMAGSKLYGVELDSISGRIARQLYPKADITVAGFETTDRRDFFDLAIGNVPFGDYKVNDRGYNRLGFSIHNYFLAKSLDQLRPGGVAAFVTSRYTMDAKNPEVRRYLGQRAELLGAIRLPNNAFKANAGAEVVSDILFLQKRDRPIVNEPEWVSLGENKDGFAINRYFLDNPNMVLGGETTQSSRFGMDYTVIPHEGIPLASLLNEAIQHIHGSYQEAELPDLGEGEEIRTTIPADPSVKNFSYALVDGEIYYRENSIMVKPQIKSAAKDRIRGMIGLRDCVRELIDLQMDAMTPDHAITEKQAELDKLYDSFSAKCGLINSKGNRLAFSDDSSYYLLCSLEVLDEDNKFLRKADMFTKRTIREARAVTSVDTASEALAVSIAEHACVDMAYMTKLSGKSVEELADELRGVIFQLPNSLDENGSPSYVTADEYLSGNVRQKLAIARRAAEESEVFRDNVEALEKAQPKDLDASEIDVRLGATWIDKKYIQEFMEDLLQPPFYLRRSIVVNYSPYTAEWSITGKKNVSYRDVNAYTTYGTSRINAYQILQDSLNLRDSRVYDTIEEPDGKERRVLNQKETTLAQQKQQAIKDAFRDWIWKDPERRQTLVELYNERFNSTRPREYDGSHISFSGMSPEISLREHQKNAIAHILYGGNTLLAHEVGSGKTFEMVAAAMESKRLGLCSKSMIVVPNHLIEQWAGEFLRLYPSANLLVARKKDFEPAHRKTFCSKIATGDYDAVIIGHSQFEKIPMSFERQQASIEKQIAEVEEGIEELRASGAERFTVKSMERTKRGLKNRLEKLLSSKKKDDVVTFEQLGVDRLFVDEAHGYKNLFLYTKMQNVAGISTTDAQKSSDMYMKCQYLDEKTGGRGVIFATGTPISNSMTELYTMMRYLQSNTLREKGWSHFDCWAAHFGETKTVIELAPEGTGYRARTRFSKFYNLPELINIWKEAADVKTADQLNLPRPQAVYHNEVAKPTPEQQELVSELSDRAAKVHSGTIDPREDNMLKITSDGRKLGLDQRIINPDLPDEQGTKINMCVENILRIWRDGEADKLTQLVFCDISTPRAKTAARKSSQVQQEESADIPAFDPLAALNASDSSFTAYDDIRSKLVAGGIPAEQIAFIHEANTEVRKKELFAKVRTGQVRVLMGSTFKMGAGMNVQDRLIALHDLDCPWRPGDLEQRSGRIIRQGNMNKQVHIYRYVTEGTFDSYLWQTVENKQEFISQIMTSKSPVRSCEDVDETALSFAEIKALCAGNPAIKEKMDLDIEVARLKVLKADHQSQQFRMEDNLLKYYPEQIRKLQGIIAGLESDIQVAESHPHPESGFVGITLNGKAFSDKEEAGTSLLEASKQATGCEPIQIGSYRGFEIRASLENFGKDRVLTLVGHLSHRVMLGNDPRGNLIRVDNVIKDIPKLLSASQDQLQNIQKQVVLAKAEIGKPFPQEAELVQKSQRLAELNAILDMDSRRNDSEHAGEDRESAERPSVLDALHRRVEDMPPHRRTESHGLEERV